MISSTDPDEADPLQALTAKQRQVLDLLIQHKTSKEISRLLGISPHTVDQRILLARAKLNVSTRSEVAQAYRHLLETQGNGSDFGTSEQSIYGFSDMVPGQGVVQTGRREGVEDLSGELDRPGSAPGNQRAPWHESAVSASREVALPLPEAMPDRFYHVLPEAFDGKGGTILRLGAIAMIAIFLTLVIMGGFAMYSELARIIDG